jgi:hypothetical protein
MLGTNTLAYYGNQITSVKSFMIQAPELCSVAPSIINENIKNVPMEEAQP